ncbi:MAG: hypothetical protein HXX13_00175 [Bacteroidetes bacterium]|nr:hypothetical protein [Bacteroidota bacterium]
MNKTEIKGKLIEACRKKILDNIASLEAAMSDAQQQANEYGAPRDRYDAFRTQLMRRRDMMAEQLSKEMVEFKVLDKLDPKKNMDKVEFGAVIITPGQNYFISVGLGKIELQDISYFTISPMVPICQALSGKRKGETAIFRDMKIHILDIF